MSSSAAGSIKVGGMTFTYEWWTKYDDSNWTDVSHSDGSTVASLPGHLTEEEIEMKTKRHVEAIKATKST
jgi:hypothetical protein